MDAAMNLLGGGLRVRVLMQGKKVPDEAATLSQIGISRNAKPESLGFMLEPSPVLTSASATAEDYSIWLPRVIRLGMWLFRPESEVNFHRIIYFSVLHVDHLINESKDCQIELVTWLRKAQG
jgi:hypothetical protein